MTRTFFVWVAVAVFALGSGAALDDVDDLGGGVFIAHAPPEITYTSPPPDEGWCQHYLDGFAISDSASQNVRIDGEGSRSVWFVLVAWTEAKEFCGVEFGLGNYDPLVYEMESYGPCYPVDGLQIQTAEWPAPNSGVSVIRVGEYRWSGNYVPIYYFVGNTVVGATVIELGVNPDKSFGGFSNCTSPLISSAATCFGTMGINTDGVACGPAPPPPRFVCCDEGFCFVAIEEDCVNAGGDWHEDLDSCQPNPCPVWGACCIADQCFDQPRDECLYLGGMWYEDYRCDDEEVQSDCGHLAQLRVCCLEDVCFLVWYEDCTNLDGLWREAWTSCGETLEDNPCKQLHVCCIEDQCWLRLEDECTQTGGDWVGDQKSCDPGEYAPGEFPCPVPAVQPVTWGRIKTIYR